MRLIPRLSILATLFLLTACVVPGQGKDVATTVNPISGTTVTVETLDTPAEPALPKPKAVKPSKPAASADVTPVAASPVAASPDAAPSAAVTSTAPAPLPKPKRVKKTKPLPVPMAGQVDASLDAITAAEAEKPSSEDVAATNPQIVPEANKPAKTPEEVAAEALLAATAAEPETPVELQSPEQVQCLKKGGVWATAGKSGAKACVKRTKDAGKSCTKQTQCEGYCLARSGTCAPITPMFGCTEILQADGREVTLCLD